MTAAFASVWRRDRRRLLDLSYRMTGSLADAEDIVQEAYARLLRSDLAAIADVRGWLITVTARLCLDHLRSAAVRRSAYVGPWLPEPIVRHPGAAPDPAERVTLDETVRMALLVVLDRLSPPERAALLLHDVFGYPFDDVGAMIGRSAAASRQLASRARRRVAAQTAPPAAADGAAERVIRRFAQACEHGDVAGLVEVLTADASGTFDSGGAVPGAPLTPVQGADAIAHTLVTAFAAGPVSMRMVSVNGEPGCAAEVGGRIVAILAFALDAERIAHVFAVGNPGKLRHAAAPRTTGPGGVA